MTMNSNKNDDNDVGTFGIGDEELKKIVNEELTKLDILFDKRNESNTEENVKNVIEESSFATAKKFKQVSDHISEKTKIAHEKLYVNYIEAFNKVSAQLDSVPRKDANSYTSAFKSMKVDEVHNLNGLWLHELYFSNCFDPHSQIHMDSKSFMRINRDFGEFNRWQKDFIASALSVGEGWVILGYHMFLNKYVNMIVEENDKSVMIGIYPVLVIDMFSHSYFRDFDIDKKSYIVTMMRQIDWNIVEERVERCEKIASVLR